MASTFLLTSTSCFLGIIILHFFVCRTHFALKQRNYDPETRGFRKRETGEEGEDTVEKAVEGLAEQIIKEDEEKRNEELVCFNLYLFKLPIARYL